MYLCHFGSLLSHTISDVLSLDRRLMAQDPMEEYLIIYIYIYILMCFKTISHCNEIDCVWSEQY